MIYHQYYEILFYSNRIILTTLLPLHAGEAVRASGASQHDGRGQPEGRGQPFWVYTNGESAISMVT
jgi:hypothetical protein